MSLSRAVRTQAGGWLVLLLALVAGAAFQGSRGLTETSETRYAEVAREMLASGDWLEPTLEGRPHWTKPPLAYWCMAAGMTLCGANAWGARLPGVLALMLATWAVLSIGRRLWGEREGRTAAAIFALGFPVVGAHIATTDIHLLAAETAAMAAAVAAARSAGGRLRRTCAMWALFGVAFMIKGPPGLLPILALVAWNRLRPREERLPLGDVRALACFAAVALPWYLLMVARHPELLEYYLGTEVVGRVASDLGHNRAWYKAPEVYGPALVGAAGIFGPWALWLAWRRGELRVARWHGAWRRGDARWLLVAWVVLPLAVFCLSRSKLPLYVLPLAAPLCLGAGRVLARHASPRGVRIAVVASLLVVVAAKGAAAHRADPRDMAALAEQVEQQLAALHEGAPVVLWDEAHNHGLGFHLAAHGSAKLEHVSAGTPPRADGRTAAAFLAHVAAGGYPVGALLVVAAGRRTALDAALVGLCTRELQRGAWHLVRLEPPRASD